MITKTTLFKATMLLTANMILATFSIAQVTQEWVERYDGPGNSGDGATSLAVDDSGNVYVIGGSNANITRDYATLKYNSAGVQQWEARYNGPGNGSNDA